MMITEPLKDLACRHAGPRIGERLVDALPQPLGDGRLLAIERPHRARKTSLAEA